MRDHPEAFGSDYESARRAGPRYAERGYFQGGPNALFAAWSSDNRIIGIAASFAETGKRTHIAHVISVYTLPDFRSNGIATALVQTIVRHLQGFQHISSIRISVSASNHQAVRCYERLGFVRWGIEPDAIALPDGSTVSEIHMVLPVSGT